MTDKAMESKKVEASAPVGSERIRARKIFIPKVDIFETKDAIVMLADMPGVDENTVDITLEKGVLTINGSVDLKQDEKMELTYWEFERGDYERAFTISDQIDQNRIEAVVKDGVLRLTLHKAEAVKPKKIAIKAG